MPAALPNGLAGVVQLHKLKISKGETISSLVAKYRSINLAALVIIARVKISQRQLVEMANADLHIHRCGFPIVILNASKDVRHELRDYVARAEKTRIQLILNVVQLSWRHRKL